MIIYILAGFATISALISFIACFFAIKRLKKQMSTLPPTSLHIDLDPVHKAIDAIPNKVLQSIVSKNNNHKGDLGELVSFMKLGAMYDRVIPLNNVVDFLAIKLPTETTEGYIHFIDSKTGKASLSKEQKAVKKLIEEKKVEFIKLRINIETGSDNGDNQT